MNACLSFPTVKVRWDLEIESLGSIRELHFVNTDTTVTLDTARVSNVSLITRVPTMADTFIAREPNVPNMPFLAKLATGDVNCARLQNEANRLQFIPARKKNPLLNSVHVGYCNNDPSEWVSLHHVVSGVPGIYITALYKRPAGNETSSSVCCNYLCKL